MMTLFKIAILFLVSSLFAASPSEVIEATVRQEFSEASRIEVSSLFLEKGENVPVDAQLEVISPHPAIGWISFRYRWGKEGVEMQRKGTALVRVYERVAVTKRPIRHGETFHSSNIDFEEREIAPFRQSGFYNSAEKIEGMRARGHLAAGMVIGFQQAEEVSMVERGQSLELVNQKGRVKVSVKVIALESGRFNQWIKVENPTSRKKLIARITAPGLASLQ